MFSICFALNMARLCQDSRSQQNYFYPCFFLHLEGMFAFVLELFNLAQDSLNCLNLKYHHYFCDIVD